jgi:hypothetical protein
MTRQELKEIIFTVIEKLQNPTPAPACGILWNDQPTATTLYAVGEEDPAPTPVVNPGPITTPGATTLYSIGEEDATTLYGINEEG